ncbi:MAG: DUF2164 domain-containing protein [Thermoplasmatota archaeon]
MPLGIPKESEKALVASLKRFAKEYLEADWGDLKAGLLLEFCVREIGPTLYNQGITDVQAVLHEKVDDLAERLLPEFGYGTAPRP